MIKNTQFVNILDDATVIHTHFKRDVGERVQNYRPTKIVKYAITTEEYEKCLAIKADIVSQFFKIKNRMILEKRGFTEADRMDAIKQVLGKLPKGSLMMESFFISFANMI